MSTTQYSEVSEDSDIMHMAAVKKITGYFDSEENCSFSDENEEGLAPGSKPNLRLGEFSRLISENHL